MTALDAHQVQPDEYDDLPELTDADFDRGVIHVAGRPVKRGRPAPNGAKVQVTLRLDRAVIEGFRKAGPGWQSRINEALGEWLSRRAETKA